MDGFGGRWFAKRGKAGFISKLVYTPRSWPRLCSKVRLLPSLRGYPSGFAIFQRNRGFVSRIKCREIFAIILKKREIEIENREGACNMRGGIFKFNFALFPQRIKWRVVLEEFLFVEVISISRRILLYNKINIDKGITMISEIKRKDL